ncbi:YfhO family protein [Streptomyces sp. NPDC003042]
MHQPLKSTTVASASAALLSMAAYCTGLAAHRTYPFGPQSRAMNDLRNQYVPFHARLWDLQHGAAGGDLFFNWQSGYGVGFLADFFTYLGNPLSWTVGVFPRHYVDFAVFLVSVFSIALAAALMTVFLGRLNPDLPWMRGLLSVGYAVCGWNVLEGAIVPMWMWGLAGLPAICIAFDWCLKERHWATGALVVAVCWYGNFYTAAMATMGAVLILLVRLLMSPARWTHRARTVWRAGSMTAAGVLLAAPAVLVPGLANSQAQPTEKYVVSVATAPLTYLAMFLPGSSATPTAPNVFVGLPVLLLVLTLPFHARVPVREKAAWLLIIVLVAASFVITPTAKAWQGFALPHGAPFRATFVLSGILVMAAWICLAEHPTPRTLLAGTATFAALVGLCLGQQPVNAYAWNLAVLGGPVTAILLLALVTTQDRRAARTTVSALLAATVFAGTAYTVFGVAVLHDPALRGKTVASTMTPLAVNAHETLRENDRWPASRIDVGPDVFVTDNDPMLLGGQGGAYYSSYVTQDTATALRSLGLGTAMGGRHLWAASDPVLQSLLSVGTHLRQTSPATVAPAPSPALPLVTLRPDIGQELYGAPTGTVWAAQQNAIGARVYFVPELTALSGRGTTPQRMAGGFKIPRSLQGAHWPAFTATCPAGSEALLYAPHYSGRFVAFGTSHSSRGQSGLVSMPVTPLGTVPPDGRIDIAFGTPRKEQAVPTYALACLDRQALVTAVRKRSAAAATAVHVSGHGITADLPDGSTGTAVIATTSVPGWACSVDHGALRAPSAEHGLLAIPLDSPARNVGCTYTPPGLKAGLTAAGIGAIVIIGVAMCARQSKKRFEGRGTLVSQKTLSPLDRIREYSTHR